MKPDAPPRVTRGPVRGIVDEAVRCRGGALIKDDQTRLALELVD